MNPEDWASVEREIGAAVGRAFSMDGRKAAGGGCINTAWIVAGNGERYFVKVNDAKRLAMFEAEAAGLAELARANAIRVPRPIAVGTSGEAAWLVLEHIDLKRRDRGADAALGHALAALHRTTRDTFGWDRDNTIGSTPQANPRSADWPSFWREARLAPQLALARRNGYTGSLQSDGEELLDRLGAFFEAYRPMPSLLHGDLWSGNAAADASGVPVLFDPAVYYGDREADIAMTELFGGFAPPFYSAYREALPLDPGYETRRELYNLYHILNHLNLFGGSYRAQAERLVMALLSEAR